jgi:hypothetical protein
MIKFLNHFTILFAADHEVVLVFVWEAHFFPTLVRDQVSFVVCVEDDHGVLVPVVITDGVREVVFLDTEVVLTEFVHLDISIVHFSTYFWF